MSKLQDKDIEMISPFPKLHSYVAIKDAPSEILDNFDLKLLSSSKTDHLIGLENLCKHSKSYQI